MWHHLVCLIFPKRSFENLDFSKIFNFRVEIPPHELVIRAIHVDLKNGRLMTKMSLETILLLKMVLLKFVETMFIYLGTLCALWCVTLLAAEQSTVR